MGSLRFMPPVTGALWSGVKVADKFGPVCPQRLPDVANETAALKRMPSGRLDYLKRLLPYLQEQSEDCLYLNIYAPAQGKRCILYFFVLINFHSVSFRYCSVPFRFRSVPFLSHSFPIRFRYVSLFRFRSV